MNAEDLSSADEARLRAEYFGASGVAYVGREFRVYPHMRVGEATAFYAALADAWDGDALAADLRSVHLEPHHEVGRLRRAYHRALVLALAFARSPRFVVVEGAEEFDDDVTAAFLRRVLARAPAAITTRRR